jgi:hypothetical protein
VPASVNATPHHPTAQGEAFSTAREGLGTARSTKPTPRVVPWEKPVKKKRSLLMRLMRKVLGKKARPKHPSSPPLRLATATRQTWEQAGSTLGFSGTERWNHSPTAMQKLRIVTLGFGARGDREWSLNEGRIPNFRAVRVALGTVYNRVEGNRRASRNGRVPPETPTVTIRSFCIAVCPASRSPALPRSQPPTQSTVLCWSGALEPPPCLSFSRSPSLPTAHPVHCALLERGVGTTPLPLVPPLSLALSPPPTQPPTHR